MSILMPLGFLIQEFAVVHNAANGRRGSRGDLHEVHPFALSQPQGFIERHDAELFFGLVKDPDFAGADLPVPPMLRFARMK
jgi:hypothetical protein